jgi:hypothetical protein
MEGYITDLEYDIHSQHDKNYKEREARIMEHRRSL